MFQVDHSKSQEMNKLLRIGPFHPYTAHIFGLHPVLGVLNKLFIKVLENMKKVVSYSQNAFVQGRQILDVALIANEATDSRLRSQRKGVVHKLDIEKAYEHVNQNLMLAMLCKMGFRKKWVHWIQFCISTERFSILVNGTSYGFFQSSRDLRQGDPLSPYLFVSLMEALSILLRKTGQGRFISSFKVGGRRGTGVEISQLPFSDDTLLFCEPYLDQQSYMSWVLFGFEASLGLKSNLGRSELILVRVVPNVSKLAFLLGCRVGKLPTTQLGQPLGATFKSLPVWDVVKERFHKGQLFEKTIPLKG